MSNIQTGRRLVVSLTSYPARMGTLDQTLETIYNQTRQADEVVLWLAREQFPELEKNLPDALLQLVAQKKLTLRWCDDLKPHKKYFYALQEYREDLIVTVDDDLLYPEHMLENLYQSWLRHPEAVSAVRAHLMLLSEAGEIRPYNEWVKETDVCRDQPSMQLFATGGAGALYPPELFPPETFDKAAVLETCLWADDLWLKAAELIADVPVVVAQPFEDLRYVPGTQESGLYHQNEDANRNDTQLAAISAWMDAHVAPGVLVRKLTCSPVGVKLLGMDVLNAHVAAERTKMRQKLRTVNAKLKQTYGEKSEINAKLKQTYAEKSEINAKLKQTYGEKSELSAKLKQAREVEAACNSRICQLQEKLEKAWAEKSEINAKLQKTYAEKSELSAKLKQAYADKTQRGERIRELEQELAAERYAHTFKGRLRRFLNFLKRPFRKQ